MTPKKSTSSKPSDKKAAEQPAEPIEVVPAPKAETSRMKADPSSRPQRSGEHFDVNQATVSGEISKIWGRGGDVYARLRVPSQAEGQDSFVNLRFPNGTVQGRDIDLQPGDMVQVSGWLTHSEFYESIRKFLSAALGEEKTFFDGIPADDLEAWRAIEFRRVNATLNVLSLEAANGHPVNRAVVEGIVARQWSMGEKDHCVRLAIYDEHTPTTTKKEGNFGRLRRKPHYVNVILPDGRTISGREVTLREKDRVRVTAALTSQGYRVTMHQALVNTGNAAVIQLMQRLPNAGNLQQISAQQESLSLEAAAIIVYASHRKLLEELE
jgi:hypothetical protein